jgi:excisionase family DNA binding protein
MARGGQAHSGPPRRTISNKLQGRPMKTKESIFDKPLLTTPQAARILDLTEYHVREAIRRGQIESVRIGKRDFVKRTWLQEVGAS